tara:strand:- start:898 stop:1665 length:768 start_codon:yes stop_codon:yes gene_type:complete
MSYSRNYGKRTVRCSFCYDAGHNKSSCSKYTAKIERKREIDPESYDVRVYDAKKAKRKASAKGRKCSYCSGASHNRASCSELRANILISQAKNAAFRQVIYERMKGLGIGVGTIVSGDRHTARVDPDDYSSATFRNPHVITVINWDLINAFNRDYTYFENNSPWHSKPLIKICQNWLCEPGWIWDSGVLIALMGEDAAASWIDGSHRRYDARMNWFSEVVSPVKTPECPDKWELGGDLKFWKAAYKKRTSWHGPL